MGYGFSLKCPKCHCSYTFALGVGMMFPTEYKKVVRKIKLGKYGAEWRKFFKENEGAAVDAEECLYVCSHCNAIKAEPNLSLYITAYGSKADEYVPLWCNSDSKYKFVRSFVHKCTKCGKRMKKVEDPEYDSYICPKCGEMLTKSDFLKWD